MLSWKLWWNYTSIEQISHTAFLFLFFFFTESTSNMVEGRYGHANSKLIYGVFSTSPNAIAGSAVCAFSLQVRSIARSTALHPCYPDGSEYGADWGFEINNIKRRVQTSNHHHIQKCKRADQPPAGWRWWWNETIYELRFSFHALNIRVSCPSRKVSACICRTLTMSDEGCICWQNFGNHIKAPNHLVGRRWGTENMWCTKPPVMFSWKRLRSNITSMNTAGCTTIWVCS